MNLFLDTNIWLSFYHFSGDDLEQLRKLIVLMDQDRLKLYLPEQVDDEFTRNRDTKVADALKQFREQRLGNLFPQMCKEYEEYGTMRKAIRQYGSAKNVLLDRLMADCSSESLKADRIIAELFGKAVRLATTEEVIARAKRRYDLGNPPGKDKSYGDAVNWECLLSGIANCEDLFFVSADADYCARTDSDLFSPFLQKEWAHEKRGRILFFKQLSSFFQDQFPDIRVAMELAKELIIRDFANSSSFRGTRRSLRQVVRFSDFTDDQLNDIVSATISNRQIYLIILDSDINRMLRTLITGNESRVEPESLRRFQAHLDGQPIVEKVVLEL